MKYTENGDPHVQQGLQRKVYVQLLHLFTVKIQKHAKCGRVSIEYKI